MEHSGIVVVKQNLEVFGVQLLGQIVRKLIYCHMWIVGFGLPFSVFAVRVQGVLGNTDVLFASSDAKEVQLLGPLISVWKEVQMVPRAFRDSAG